MSREHASRDSTAHLRVHKRSLLHHNHRSNLQMDANLQSPARTAPQLPNPIELVRRSDGCTDSSSPGCKQPESSNSVALPISIGIAVPVVIALVVFIILHRRHIRRLRKEDANDRTRSLDFGMGNDAGDGEMTQRIRDPVRGSAGKAAAQAAGNGQEKSGRNGHGRVGMSIDLGNPYMLPPEMHSSRESLHSLSRTLAHGSHDPYRPANAFQSGAPSIRSSRAGADDASTRTGSTGPRFKPDTMNQNLLRNAQSMSRSGTPPVSSPDTVGDLAPRWPENTHQAQRTMSPPPKIETPVDRDSHTIRQSNNYLASFIRSREPSVDPQSHERQPRQGSLTFPKRKESMLSNGSQTTLSSPRNSPPPPMTLPTIDVQPAFDDPNNQDNHNNQYVQNSNDGTGAGVAQTTGQGSFDHPPGQGIPSQHTSYDEGNQFASEQSDARPVDPKSVGLGVSEVDLESKRLSILRPLPPDDPTDNPEQRANRIRSFYKEYFSENEPARAYTTNGAANYYEDYGSEFLGEGTVFDPSINQFVVAQAPYAEPVTRRAMTPPPRGPPTFQQGPPGSRRPYLPSGSSPVPRSRAFSTASTSRMGPGPRNGPNRRPAPPPNPLRTLPTPHLLKEDAFALPIDFAPPSNVRDRAAGRPDSPLSMARPFSPAVPIASPLASSYNELASMPSPHALRKSGVFTALDFAPPPRIRGGDTASDAGSIRSGRSNGSAMSAAQIHSLRSGAYRVSRIPKELVGTRSEFTNSLKPTWKVGS